MTLFPSPEKSPWRWAAVGTEIDPGVGAPAAGGLVVDEEERLVLPDRTAQRAPELLEVEGRLRGLRVFEIAASVQGLVAQEVEGAAAHGVRPGLEGGVDHRAAGAAELRRVVAGLDLELLDRVHVGVERGLASVVAVVVDAVEQVVVLAAARAVHHEGRVDVAVAPLGGADDPARQGGEVDVVAAVQGQSHDLPRVDDLAQRRGLRLDERRFPLHDDGFGDIARLQHEVDPQAILDPKDDAFTRLLLEPRELHAHRVDADPQRRSDVVPRGIGDRDSSACSSWTRAGSRARPARSRRSCPGACRRSSRCRPGPGRFPPRARATKRKDPTRSLGISPPCLNASIRNRTQSRWPSTGCQEVEYWLGRMQEIASKRNLEPRAVSLAKRQASRGSRQEGSSRDIG